MSASSHSGIAATSIDKINGIRYSDISTVAGTQRAASYFLDTYTGAKAAYSLRQLSSTATTAITVENSSGTTADIGVLQGGFPRESGAIVDIGVIIAASNNPKVARDSIIPPP